MNEEHQTILELITEYEAFLENGGELFLDEKAYLQLIEYYENEDRADKALEVTDRAISSYSYSLDFYLKKARILIDEQEDAPALAVLDQANLLAPAQPEIALLRAEAMANLGMREEAFALLEGLKKQADSRMLCEIYVCEGFLYEIFEEYECAFHALKAALFEYPRHQEALERIWLCVENTKRYEESVALHHQILDLDPYSYLAWYNLGHAQAYLGNYNEAIEAYEYAFIINDKFEFAYRDCAELCFEIKKYRKALRCYLELMEHVDADSDVYFCIGQCYQALEEYNAARNYYMHALQSDSFNDEILYCIGECFAEEGKWKSAVRYYNKAIRMEDRREEYYAALGEAYFELGELIKAEDNFKIALELAPEDIHLWMQYTGFLIETDRVDDALRALQDAEEYASGAEALYCRIACLFALGRRQEAFYWLGEALMEDYDMHRALFEMMPSLEHDPEVISMVLAQRPEQDWTGEEN